jgi:hypothetical protein
MISLRGPNGNLLSAVGTKLPRTCATACPQLAKADAASQAHPLVNPPKLV